MPLAVAVRAHRTRRWLGYTVATVGLLLITLPIFAATLPPGFTESAIAGGLASPTAMSFAPDGRLFVCEQSGRLRVVKNGVLLPAPFVTLAVHSAGERGLLGVAFDPDFGSNQYVYVYYTATSPTYHNRISRFTADGDVAAAGSEVVLLELDPLSGALNHNGGALHFGPDGKLYAAVGDNANGANAQSLGTLHGKILRLNRDGSIPPDNPFYTTATGKHRTIWALGLRNPFTFSIDRVTGTMFINDVGEGGWEEINEGAAGANYGWPDTEGYTSDPRFTSPRFAYAHSGGACAIAGSAFYHGTAAFPAEYGGDYFFADYCAGWIRRLDAAGNWTTAAAFATATTSPVDLQVSSDGGLYYLARGSGSSTGVVYRIEYAAGGAPQITNHPVSATATAGSSAAFSVRASGSAPLTYQWQRNGSNIPGATAPDYAISPVVLSDNGTRVRAVVSNDVGTAVSNEAVFTVTTNQAPVASITLPTTGTLYNAGEEIGCAGTGTDPEDGTLAASAFTWQVDFHHDTHSHPFIPPTSGVTGGSFTIPTTGEISANVWYRLLLTVVDSEGLSHTTYRDIMPRKSRITLDTNPSGLQLKLDGQPVATPVSVDSVVGLVRSLEAVSPQLAGGSTWTFGSWSDGGATAHDIQTPSEDATYTAVFAPASAGDGLVARWDMDAVSAGGNTVVDITGSGNDGAITGAVRAPGIHGDSLAFDGVDDRVDIRGAPALDTAGSFTVSFWYLADEHGGSIAAKPYGDSWLNSWQFEFAGDALSFTSGDGDDQHFDLVSVPGPGVWVHIAGMWDGVTKRMFVNGASVLAIDRFIAMDAGDVVLGGDYNAGQFLMPFKGRIDDVRVYRRALSNAEIQELYGGAPPPGEPDATSAPDPTTVMQADFDEGGDGFQYIDDAFRGTGSPGYASGTHVPSGGFSGGALRVVLGGIDDAIVDRMSGGWRRSFSVAEARTATLSFRYRLTQASNYEDDEFSEVLVGVDGLQPGVGGNDYVARIAGDGNGGDVVSTGWQLFEADLGTLAAGTHTLTIGAYNSRKTFNDEVTRVLIDDVMVVVH